ncbi:response regulator [Leptospira interrogans]|uniref:Two-component hybrid sensor and regulator n=21 Tax=Leptospira interrogans TaxID=173 RepID=Q8F227_LEPIN|nr:MULTISPECIES: ATP-binding protein [Leptospira]EMF42647.1 response regulator receiver domain protein [Leptospira interrogans serovar Lora str. TE 1992]EMF73762.1 response regulator receiver domain protein [Leptospira interrogans serovar Canicola str. LT1962]EMG10220.1 response regulator receiver domain protein [Leptospira interrogans serovar Grippotyphosa str. LT2186]EMG19030.1 response regulator receiver domain protein [Leptospira interrogans serovar Copenhageni str. LT2050]EMM82255.1 respo
MTPMRILFLDDEEMIRDLFREIFGTIHDLTLIGSAEEALEVCKDKSFDLIITDVRLPKMSGIDFISRLRDKEINTPFIVITGNQDIEISIRALRLGAVDFFIKPFRMDAIRHSLQKFESLFISSQELISKNHFQLTHSKQNFAIKPSLKNLNQYVNLVMRSISLTPGIHTDDILSIKLALYELLGNAIEHGFAGISYEHKASLLSSDVDYVDHVDKICADINECVLLEIGFEDQKVYVSLKDRGAGFDPSKVPDPVTDPNASYLSGRGIFLARMNVDELVYNDIGNEVSFSKTLKRANSKVNAS